MPEHKFALVFWNDDQQFSVVKSEDIKGEAKLGEILPVAWRVKKKKGEVTTSWYEAKILQISDNEQSLQLLCESYAEDRARELNNVAGKKRKRTKTAKAKELTLEEQKSLSTCASIVHVPENSSKKKKVNEEKKKKGNHSKDPSSKSSQLESSKLMAREVIQIMQRNSAPEKDDLISVDQNKTSLVVNSASPLTLSSSENSISTPNCLTPPSSDTRVTPPSFLHSFQSSKWSSTSNTNTSQEAIQTRDDDIRSTSTPTNSTSTDKLYNQSARRELIRDETPLSAQLSSAIRLSYDCDDEWDSQCNEWLDSIKQKEADENSPECSECAELRHENSRLKNTIARLKKEKERFAGLLNAPPTTVIYIEALAKYLRDASSGVDACNDDVMEIFQTDARSKKQQTGPTLAPVKFHNVSETSAANVPLPDFDVQVKDTPESSPSSSPLSHFERGDGKQELCPGSGVFIPTGKLRQCHHKSGSDLKVLFHGLMEHFFSEETLAMSVAFGNRVLPAGKQVLDPNIVSAIKGYLLASAKIFNVAPLESTKLNKMFTNKCTCAQTKLKKKVMVLPK